MSDTPIVIGSIYGMKSQQGIVELQVGTEKVQMDIPKARHVCQMLHEAIEAAISDALLMKFLKEKVGLRLTPEGEARALLDFREMRQGSRDVVNPT